MCLDALCSFRYFAVGNAPQRIFPHRGFLWPGRCVFDAVSPQQSSQPQPQPQKKSSTNIGGSGVSASPGTANALNGVDQYTIEASSKHDMAWHDLRKPNDSIQDFIQLCSIPVSISRDRMSFEHLSLSLSLSLSGNVCFCIFALVR